MLLRPFIAMALASSVWWVKLDSVMLRALLSLLVLLVLAFVLDPAVRERFRELIVQRRGWGEPAEELPKAHGGINA